jgi:hypothetical protein
MRTSFHYLASALKVKTARRIEVHQATECIAKLTKEHMRIVTACFCVLILLGLPNRLVCAEGEAELRFNWQVGKRYTMSLLTSNHNVLQTFVPDVPTILEKTVFDEKSDFTISVLKAAPKKGCELVVEYLSTKLTEVKYKNGSVVGTNAFDSTADPKKDVGIPVAAWNRAFIGTKIKYLLDSDYHVLHVDGIDELSSKMMAHAPSLKKDISTPIMAEARFGTNALEELLQKLMVVGMPKKYLKAGDQWTYRTESNRGLTVIESQFTFAGLENHLSRDCAHVVIEGQIKSSSDRGKLPPGMAIPKVQGQVKGNLWLDTRLEIIVERTIMEESVTVWDMPLLHGDETVPTKRNQKKTVTCRLIKVEDN